MSEKKTYPYSDSLMTFDEVTGRYYLTEQALTDAGIMLRSNLSVADTSDSETLVRFAIRRTTTTVYGFIHRYNADTAYQDYLITHVPSMRAFLYDALIAQAMYTYLNGDMGFSADKQEQEARYQPELEEILGQNMPELGRSILYMGTWRHL